MRFPIYKILLFFAVINFSNKETFAQADSDFVSHRAFLFADSLLKSFNNSDFSEYVNISYPGVVKYYGGKQQFTAFIRQERDLKESLNEQLQLVQLINEKKEWQCVMKKINEKVVNGKNVMVISYLIGQSKDEGKNWRFIDVAFNSINNIRLIMPDMFENIILPNRQVVFQ